KVLCPLFLCEGYSSGIRLPDREKTLEFEPEKPVYSSNAKTKMEEGGKAPVFLKRVSNVEVCQGDVARLSVTVTGSPTPKIHWFFNKMKLTPSMDCKLVFAGNDHSLILPYAGVQDEGEYRCVASNVHGETTCSAHLHVRQRIPGVPCFTREPESVRCAPGFTAVFEYTVAGEPCPDVQWFKGTEQLFSDARRSVAHHPDGSGSLTVWECMEEDTGLYTCRAVSALGEATCSAELLVLPEEHAVPESITTFVGKSAKFLCTVSGTPVIDVAWQKDGTTISPSDHHKISKVENKHVLEISHLTTSDRGVYTCKASNKFGADICQAEMVIIDKPHFIKVLQSVQSAVNKKIHLECQVDEDRKVTVGWTKDGNKIPPGKDYKIYFEDKIASLEIPLAKLKDSGHYVCTASNEAGSSSSSASITVRGKLVLHPLYLCSSWVPHFFFCRPAIRSIHLLLIFPDAFQCTVCGFNIAFTSQIQELLLYAEERWMKRARRNHKNCSSAKIMLIFFEVMFCSCTRNQSFKALYFSLLSFFSFPFPLPFFSLPPPPFSPFFPLFFPFSSPSHF
uniref:Ig-like domain-containing protein n=1 Tax=Strix occidentalis caurina TaxID=311401 RepID=A0A8D0FU97_STROC